MSNRTKVRFRRVMPLVTVTFGRFMQTVQIFSKKTLERRVGLGAPTKEHSKRGTQFTQRTAQR